jgi:MoxR-like ATPase
VEKQALEKKLEYFNQKFDDLTTEIHKVIVGQDEVIQKILLALFCKGHCLLVGVPGLAKTLMINTLAKALDLSFQRIQFTPDLMPTDITGTDVLEEDEKGHRYYRFIKGPVFANIVLADEINRTPPKTQSALLEAMQEHKVTSGGHTYTLDEPFFVLATQNPIEQEGTYPLPEAQLDRFMFNILIDYPSFDEEIEIVKSTTSLSESTIQAIFSRDDILELQNIVYQIPVSDIIYQFAIKLVQLSRPSNPDAPEFIRQWVTWGAGPRASQYLILAAKALSLLKGRYTPLFEDLEAVAGDILRHRIILNFAAEAEGVTPDQVVTRLLKEVKNSI